MYYENTSLKYESIVYDKKINGYYLKHSTEHCMTNQEIVPICKILLESKAFNKKELHILIDKLLLLSSLKNNDDIKEIIKKELFYHVPLKHEKNLLKKMWELTMYINQKEIIRISYSRKDDLKKSMK